MVAAATLVLFRAQPLRPVNFMKRLKFKLNCEFELSVPAKGLTNSQHKITTPVTEKKVADWMQRTLKELLFDHGCIDSIAVEGRSTIEEIRATENKLVARPEIKTRAPNSLPPPPPQLFQSHWPDRESLAAHLQRNGFKLIDKNKRLRRPRDVIIFEKLQLGEDTRITYKLFPDRFVKTTHVGGGSKFITKVYSGQE